MERSEEPIEIWKDIPGYEGLYQASSLGNIKSLQREVNRVRSKITSENKYRVKEKIFNFTSFDKDGYCKITLFNKMGRKQFRAHRLIAITFISNIEDKSYINHINGIKTDNRIQNLEWCTPKENIHHAWKTGLCKSKPGKRGETSPFAKLKNHQVLEIREKYKTGNYSQRKLGVEYGVSKNRISDIVKRISWFHI